MLLVPTYCILFPAEPRCENLTLSNENLTIVHDSNPITGTLAVYNCTRGVNGTIDTRMCGCNGMWSQSVPRCREPEPEPEGRAAI